MIHIGITMAGLVIMTAGMGSELGFILVVGIGLATMIVAVEI
jgi:hypothetical protein